MIGEVGVYVTLFTLVNTTPCRQEANDISSLAGSNKDLGEGELPKCSLCEANSREAKGSLLNNSHI